jgi:hypothetical protein
MMKMPDYPGDLKRGDSGPRVVLLQQLLCLDGYGVKCDGEYGACTEAAVKSLQAAAVPPGPGTLTRAGFDKLTLRMWLLDRYDRQGGSYLLDLGQLCYMALASGIREFPGNRGPWFPGNRGPWVSFFMGGEDGQPWCAAFATWLTRKAGAAVPIMWGCGSIASWAMSEDRLSESPTAGGLFLLPHTTGIGYAHTGIVAEVCGAAVRTVEGNSNDDGSANGDRVVQRFRPSAGLMYVRLT